jgi:Phosphoribosyl transferase domain
MADEREILTWDLFGTASRELAQQVADDGFEPDIILAIARGGLLIAGALGYALSIKNLYTMNVEYYTGVDERLEVPMILPPTPELVEVEQAHVLIADDVADTGSSAPERWRRSVAASCTRSPGPSCSASTSGAGPTGGSTSRGATRTRSRSARGWPPSRTPEQQPAWS